MCKNACWKTTQPKHLYRLGSKYIKEELIEKSDGYKVLEDRFVGREKMKNVKEKKYLGDIISSDGRNSKNIRERTKKSNGTINNIVSTLTERPYGKHNFKAYKILRQGLLLGGMLTNI